VHRQQDGVKSCAAPSVSASPGRASGARVLDLPAGAPPCVSFVMLGGGGRGGGGGGAWSEPGRFFFKGGALRWLADVEPQIFFKIKIFLLESWNLSRG
jgi:hypothetical protein